MCGIVGAIRFRGTVDRSLLERQRDILAHRGPDSQGLWCSEDARVGFGHRRLAIIDLSPAGHQPMVDPITGNVITFNGEIYNFRELRAELSSRGHRWQSQSDTEVILAAWREWGTGALTRLEGMFAFALFDARAHRVILARDRAGEKP
ncbi:MAG: asparagine synthetase, partial [Gemmatimonadota bacterium]